MGLTLPQTYRYVLLPNAYRVIVPPMTSEMMNLVKNSAIASTIGLADSGRAGGQTAGLLRSCAWESFYRHHPGLCFHQRGDYADYVCGRA